jgi:lipopolysaccharide export LptBFGC system permease protein LptF
MAEVSMGSLRQQAVEMRGQGRNVQAGEHFIAYHLRWAFVGTPPVFAIFALGVVALRVGRAATAGIGLIGPVLYITYLFELSNAEVAILSDERIALTLAWLPNVAMILMSVAFLTAERSEHDQQPSDLLIS